MIQKTVRRQIAPLAFLPLLTAALPAGAQLLPRPEVLPQPSVPTTAAPLSFEEIFAGVNPAPLTLKTTDLKGEWRLVTIKMRPEVENSGSQPPTRSLLDADEGRLLRDAMGAAPGQFITQGQTVAGGGELFLVAYRMKFDEADFIRASQAAMRGQNTHAPSWPDQLDAFTTAYARERPLELSLINVKLLGELSGVRAFNAELQAASLRALTRTLMAEDAERNPAANTTTPLPATPGSGATGMSPKPPTAAPGTAGLSPKPPTPASTGTQVGAPKPPVVVTPMPVTSQRPAASNVAARNAASQNNLKELGALLKAYAEDHGDVLPPMGTPAQAKAALAAYAKGLSIWQRPDTGAAYLPNPMLSGRKPAHISNPDEFIAFYEANPSPDGTRGVVFLNGSVKRVPQNDWARAKKASKLR